MVRRDSPHSSGASPPSPQKITAQEQKKSSTAWLKGVGNEPRFYNDAVDTEVKETPGALRLILEQTEAPFVSLPLSPYPNLSEYEQKKKTKKLQWPHETLQHHSNVMVRQPAAFLPGPGERGRKGQQ